MTDVEKIEVAIRLLDNGETYSVVSQMTGLSYKTLKRYLGMSRKGGIDAALESRGRNKYYQTAEKVGAVTDVLRGRGVSEVAMGLGASEYTVRRWVQQYQTGGIDALKDGRRLRKGSRIVSAEDYVLLTQILGKR